MGTTFVWPIFDDATALGRAAALCAWWFGATADGDTRVVIARSRPGVEPFHLPLPTTVDESIAFRLSKMALTVEPVPSLEAYGRQLLDAAADDPQAGLLTLAPDLPADLEQAFGPGRVHHADDHQRPEATLSWIAAATRGQPGRGPAGFRRLKRAAREARRVVVAGPDTSPQDCDAISGETLFLTPDMFLELSGERRGKLTAVALDDPVRHLGPSRMAAAMRERVFDAMAQVPSSHLVVPVHAEALVRSRMPGTFRDRLAVVPTPVRLDPGPATLVALAIRVSSVVDVIGFSGAPDRLADDQISLHGAYSLTAMAPSPMRDVVADADRLGTQLSALQRTAHEALATRDRGRAPTALTVDGVRFPEDAMAHRFDPTGVRKVLLRASFGGQGGEIELFQLLSRHGGFEERKITGFSTGDSDLQPGPLWPDAPGAQLDAVLNAIDAAMPELVLSGDTHAQATLVAPPPQLAPASSVQGTAIDESVETEAPRRIVNRSLRDADADQLELLSAQLVGRVLIATPQTPWETLNLARLEGQTLVLVDATIDAVPQAVIDAASMVLAIVTDRAVLPLNRAQTAGDIVFLVAHDADTGGIADAAFDPDDYGGLQGPDDALGLAIRVVYALAHWPIAVLGSAPAQVQGVLILGRKSDDGAVAAGFHAMFAPDDWKGSSKVLLGLPAGQQPDALAPLFAGLGPRLMVGLPSAERVTLGVGETVFDGTASPRTPGDPHIVRTLGGFAANLVILEEGAVDGPIDKLASLEILRLHVPADVADDPRVEEAGAWPAGGFVPGSRTADLWRMILSQKVADLVPEPRGSTVAALSAEGFDGVLHAAPLAGFGAAGRGQGKASAPRYIDAQRRTKGGRFMSDVGAGERRGGFHALWPWPGTVFLVLLAGWLFYMGYSAQVADLKTAFYGLGAVTGLLVLLALRTAGRRRSRPNTVPAYGEVMGERRSAIPQPEFDTPAAEAELQDDGMPRNARMRAHSGYGAPAAEDADLEPQRLPDLPPEPAGTIGGPSAPSGGRSEPGTVANLPAQPAGFDAAIKQVEALINREKAERGAQIARLEGLIKQATPAGDGDGDLDEKLKRFLPITAFNKAMNEKVMPRLDEVMEKKVAENLSPEKLREKLGTLGAAVAEGGENAAAASIAEVRAIAEKANAEIAALREHVGKAGEVGSSLGEAASGAIADVHTKLEHALAEIDSLKKAVINRAATGDAATSGEVESLIPEALRMELDGFARRVDQQVSGAMKTTEELRGNLANMMRHVTAMGDQYTELLSKVDRIGDALPPSAQPSGGEVKSEVDALRDALTTIIQQNREIREQQDMLTARFDPPSRDDGGDERQ